MGFNRPYMTRLPNGNLLVVCNDSGYVFQIDSVNPPPPAANLRLSFHGAEGVSLRWTGAYGRGCRVERTFDLDSAGWQPIGAAGRVGGDGQAQFIDAEAGAHPRGFHRILPSL